MKIFQIVTLSESGGAQSVVINLANNLVKEHDVFVIAGGNGTMWQQLDKNVKAIKIRSLKRNISFLDLLVWIRLLWINIHYRPDIVHLHSSKIGILGRLVFSKKKIVYTVHGFDSIRVAFRKFLPLERILQKRVHKIIAVSMYDEKNLILEGIGSNVKTIYNGISDQSIMSEKKQAPIIHIIEKSKNKNFIVLCIARLAKPKRFDIFCEVAKRLPDICFFWIGNQKEIQGTLPENIFCFGEIKNAAVLNDYVDLFMLPSDYEGLPISIIEALSYSKPVIASNVGGIGEILNGKNGFAVENTVESFVERIFFYKENQQEYKQACHVARKSYEEKFTVSKMVNGYLSIYYQIKTQQ